MIGIKIYDPFLALDGNVAKFIHQHTFTLTPILSFIPLKILHTVKIVVGASVVMVIIILIDHC